MNNKSINLSISTFRDHINRVRIEMGGNPGFSITEQTLNVLDSNDVLKRCTSALDSMLKDSKGTLDTTMAYNDSGLRVHLTVVPTSNFVEAQGYFIPNYTTFVNPLLGAVWQTKSLAHWIVCCDKSGNYAILLGVFPGSPDGLAVFPRELLHPGEMGF